MRLLLLLPLMALQTVQSLIQGINVYGLETERRDFVCSWQHDIDYYIEKVNNLGFNSLRVPVSYQYIREGNFHKLDRLFDAAETHGNMSILLDMHRLQPNRQAVVPTENGVSLDQFVDAWIQIASRYESRPHLWALDLFNEYQGTDSGYWNQMSRDISTRLEQRFPNRFTYLVGGVRWGGDIHDINIEDVAHHDRVRYTIHKYIFSSSQNFERDWDYSFGAFPSKVIVGEWGYKSEKWEEAQWAARFVNYLKSRGIRDTYFWTIAHSGDTGGLWRDDCETLDQEKVDLLHHLWYDNSRMLRSSSSTQCLPYTHENWYSNQCAVNA